MYGNHEFSSQRKKALRHMSDVSAYPLRNIERRTRELKYHNSGLGFRFLCREEYGKHQWGKFHMGTIIGRFVEPSVEHTKPSTLTPAKT